VYAINSLAVAHSVLALGLDKAIRFTSLILFLLSVHFSSKHTC
jgi:hypothetical protein